MQKRTDSSSGAEWDQRSHARRLRFTKQSLLGWLLMLLLLPRLEANAGTLIGKLRDPNWFARRSESEPYGVGQYEYGINGNARQSVQPGLAASTGIFGEFSGSVPAGFYTVSSWDVWWRPAFAFDVFVPVSGTSALVDLRLKAAMWGYAAFWDPRGFYEFGQTFVATGPVTMIHLRCPFDTTYTLTIHENAPGGPQVGVSRTFSGVGDHRPIYGFGDMPTVAGRKYYVRIRSDPSRPAGVIRLMDPRPDNSDPMPGGALFMGSPGNVREFPDQDLGLTIICDDDGLITNLYTRGNGASGIDARRVGQSFIARGVSLVSAAFWLPDPAWPLYEVRAYKGTPGESLESVGTPKFGKPPRVSADPQMIVTWSPGECPLIPGESYYLEVTRPDGGAVNAVMVNSANPFRFGQAYRERLALPSIDLAGSIMEEESPGSATRKTLRFLGDPHILESERGTNELVVRWRTDQPSNSRVEFAEDFPPYTRSIAMPELVTDHSVRITGLRSHTLHHYQVISEAEGSRPAISRDLVITTRPATQNLLVNPGFELGSGPSPRQQVNGWNEYGDVDVAASDGGWFFGLRPRSERWLLQGAVNGATSDGGVYQRVPVELGKDYVFTCWITTWPRENNTWKYDVWQHDNRLIYMRLGIDPNGGVNPASPAVQWTPRTYSHRRWNPVSKRVRASNNFLTVFISMEGAGVEWHLYGVDDAVLTEWEAKPTVTPRFISTFVQGQTWGSTIQSGAGSVNIIEASEDLSSWSVVTNTTSPDGILQFQDSLAGQRRFYRVIAK